MDKQNLNDQIKAPTIEIGKKLKFSYIDNDGVVVKTNATVISNNTIDYVTLAALYDIEVDVLDENGHKIIVQSIPEEILLK